MQIKEVQEKVSPVLKEYGVERASVFGSISRGEDRSDSDVDILVELGPSPMGALKYMELIEKMEARLGREVDLVTEGSAKRLKPYIASDLKVIYEK